MADDIAQWAKKRAREVCIAEGHANSEHMTLVGWEQFATFKALARYIAEHEEPPADALEVAIAEAYEAIWEDKDGMNREDVVRGLARELRNRGIELGKSQ